MERLNFIENDGDVIPDYTSPDNQPKFGKRDRLQPDFYNSQIESDRAQAGSPFDPLTFVRDLRNQLNPPEDQ